MIEQRRASLELPPPTVELVLFRVHVQALITVLGRKKAERYLRVMAETLADEENLAAVFQIRPASQNTLVREARKGAAAAFQMMLPLWLANIPRQ